MLPRLSFFRRVRRRAALAAATLLLATIARAFPPAPFHTLYGTVRDEQGRTLHIEGAVVVIYKNGVELLRKQIGDNVHPDQSYQIRFRMDMQRAGTRLYSSLATPTGTDFSLAILINDIAYYPIEMSAPRAIGQPGERVRLDLTLGVDSDGDGLPDAWEQSQLFAAGILPGENGWDLSLIDRDGDFDHDGISNFDEYVAGTFATDPTDYLALQIVGKSATSAHLQFFAIYGKIYTLETSSDLKTWSPASLYLSDPDGADGASPPPAAQTSFPASSTGIVDLYADAADASSRALFYRLKVR